ncbi:MAG: hypothetical protein EWM45_17870 [Rhodopseudomonas palustris]|nr:MAG: hypothetical protein EWM45_17870 [Rhodopseudomonas palustris]
MIETRRSAVATMMELNTSYFDGDRSMVVVKLTGPAMYLETDQPEQVLQGALHRGRKCREHRHMNRKYRDLQRES